MRELKDQGKIYVEGKGAGARWFAEQSELQLVAIQLQLIAINYAFLIYSIQSNQTGLTEEEQKLKRAGTSRKGYWEVFEEEDN